MSYGGFKPKTQILTGRAARREKERREKHQAVMDLRNMPPREQHEIAVRQQAIQRISRNGITPQDLEENYNIGFNDGFKKAAEPVIKSCYAAVCLALHELHGFGAKRCCDVLNSMDEKVLWSMTSMELIDEVFDKIGVRLNFDEVMGDRASVTEEKSNGGKH